MFGSIDLQHRPSETVVLMCMFQIVFYTTSAAEYIKRECNGKVLLAYFTRSVTHVIMAFL